MTPEWYGTISGMGPQVLAAVEALERDVSPPIFTRILELCAEVDDAAGTAAHVDEERRWKLLLAHVPGLALMLEHLNTHIDGHYLECCQDGGSPRQRLRAEYAGGQVPQ
jgi:hypothetical protein